MAEALVRSHSPVEYFRELVDAAMQHQRVSAQELTSFYVVNLLASFMHLDHSPVAREDEDGRWKEQKVHLPSSILHPRFVFAF